MVSAARKTDDEDELGLTGIPAHVPETILLGRTALLKDRTKFALAVVVPIAGAIAAPFLAPPSWLELALFTAFFFVSVAGIELGFHRLFSHRAFQPHRALEAALAIAGCLALQGPPSYWVAHHRRHHQYADQDGDPHSPRARTVRAFLHAHLTWFFSAERAYTLRYARDVAGDPLLRAIEKLYPAWIALSFALPAICGAAWTQDAGGAIGGLFWGGFARVVAVQHGTYAINSICHLAGTRPFRSADESRNIAALTFFTLGGSLHNNHHAFPSSARNDLRPSDLDPGWWVLAIFAKLGWIKHARTPNAQMIARRSA